MSNKPLCEFVIEDGAIVKIYDESNPDWSLIKDEETLSKIDRGDLIQVYIIVSIWDKTGELEGMDSLGGVELFANNNLKDKAMDIVTEYGMVQNAKDDLTRKLKNLFKEYGVK